MSSQISPSKDRTQLCLDVGLTNYKEVLPNLINQIKIQESIHEKVVLIKKLTSQTLPVLPIGDLECDLFVHVMPLVNEFTKSLFCKCTCILESLQSNKLNTTVELQELLQVLIDVLTVTDTILRHIIENKVSSLSSLKSVLVNVTEMVFCSFEHCKLSNDIYKTHCEQLREILQLFKKTQDVHSEVLQILNSNILLDDEATNIIIIEKILEMLENIGEVLCNLNLLSFANNWKTFTSVFQKYHSNLSDNFNIKSTVMFLSFEILKILKSSVEAGVIEDRKLKKAEFMLKVLSKILLTDNKHRLFSDELWGFFTCTYNYYFVYHTSNSKLINELEVCILSLVDQLFTQLTEELNLLEILPFENILTIVQDNELGFLFMGAKLLQSASNEDIECSLKLINVIFKIISNCYSSLFKHFCTVKYGNQTIYNQLVVAITYTVLNKLTDFYPDIEDMLAKALLSGNIWVSIFGQDVWLLLLKNLSPNLCYETLCSILDTCDCILKINVSENTEHLFIKNFTRELYGILPPTYKIKLIETFTITHLNIWCCIGFENIPGGHENLIESVIFKLMQTVALITNDNFTFDDFIYMCTCLQALSTSQLDSTSNITKLSKDVLSLWSYVFKNNSLPNIYYNYFINSLLMITCTLVNKLKSYDILTVLKSIKETATVNSSVKLSTLKLLHSIALTPLKNSPEYPQIIQEISNLYSLLLSDSNSVIIQESLAKFSCFLNTLGNAQHRIQEETISKCSNSTFSRQIIDDFLNKKIGACEVLCDEYLRCQEAFQFKHECIQFSNYPEPLSKRAKSETTDVNLVITFMKTSVDSLKKLPRSNFSPQNLADISDIISQLKHLT